jgi:hypothetical protein
MTRASNYSCVGGRCAQAKRSSELCCNASLPELFLVVDLHKGLLDMKPYFRNGSCKLMFLAAALLLPLSGMGAAFQNGDFESGPGTFDIVTSADAPTGWIPGGTLGNAALFNQTNQFGVIGIVGPRSVGFGGNGATGATLSQTFDTLAGQTYNVNYFVTSQQGIGATLQTALVQALNGATVLGSVTESVPSLLAGESFHWYAGPTLTFVATGPSSTLRFTDTSSPVAAGGCCNWALDGVTVAAQVVAAVPEPQTYAMLFAGLVVLGFMTRRRDPSV